MAGRLSEKISQMENSRQVTLDEWNHMASGLCSEVEAI